MRTHITEEQITDALDTLRIHTDTILKSKGRGAFASSHEVLGVLTEEMRELEAEVQAGYLHRLRQELLDVAQVALFGVACIDADALEW